MNRPLLAIPGPVEISPAVREAAAQPPRGHQDPGLIEDFGRALGHMRSIWSAPPESQPFVIGGSGTLAMDTAVSNLVEPGDVVVVVVTGYFSRRLAEMVRRAGGDVVLVEAPTGDAPSHEDILEALDLAQQRGPVRALSLTHVDTSTGVLIDPGPVTSVAKERGVLVLLDGVCATGGERLAMSDWGVDVALTGSQKALGLPPGLALMVVSPAALEVRRARRAPAPPMTFDWLEWLPIHQAYEARTPSYFSTPATSLIAALAVGLDEIVAIGVEAQVRRHRHAALALRAAWGALGLRTVPVTPELEAHTLSNLWLPAGVGDEARSHIAKRGALVAGGLLPDLRGTSFRVGHMGWMVRETATLRRVVTAVAHGLADAGARLDPEAGLAAFDLMA